MAKKLKGVLCKHKYAFSIFAFYVIYNFVIVCNFSLPKINDLTFTFHMVDYSIGFCSELLPGAIYNALFSAKSADMVNVYFSVVYYLFLLAVSFLLEKFLCKFDAQNRFIAFIIVLFFITGPVTLAPLVVFFGALDTYWFFLAVVFLIIVQNKYLKWFVPILFVLSLFIHVAAMMSFIPFCALIVLLEASRNEKVRKSYVAIFTISVLLTVAMFLYFLLFSKDNLILSLDAFRAFASERNIPEWGDKYYEYALYRISFANGTEMINAASAGNGNFITQVLNAIWIQTEEIYKNYAMIDRAYYLKTISVIFISMPIIVMLYNYVLSRFKKEKINKLRCFVWFCALFLLPFAFIVTSALFATDIIRWLVHGVIFLFILVMYEIYRSSDTDYLESLNKRLNNSSYFAVIIYFVLYMMCTVDPVANIVG